MILFAFKSRIQNEHYFKFQVRIKEQRGASAKIRAVARSENPGGLVVPGGDNVPPWLR